MAKVSSKSSLVGKLGDKVKKAVLAHKDDETKYGGGGDLPAGIEGGLAQLTECKFGVYEKGDMKGEYYFLASGIVVEPKVHNDIRVEGLRTQIGPEPICETPTRSRPTVEDHVAWVLNEMRKLGVDTSGLGAEDLEATAAALKEEKPYFRFRTWKGAKPTTGPYKDQEPRTQHEWRGLAEYAGEVITEDVVDHTEPAGDEPEAVDNGAEQDEVEEVDLEALGKAADAGDSDAAAKLEELASENGINAEEVATWAEVAEMLSQFTEEPAEEGEEATEAPEPQKGELYYYKPPKARKTVECEVTAVFAGKQAVNLKSMDDGKLFRSVPWADLKDSA